MSRQYVHHYLPVGKGGPSSIFPLCGTFSLFLVGEGHLPGCFWCGCSLRASDHTTGPGLVVLCSRTAKAFTRVLLSGLIGPTLLPLCKMIQSMILEVLMDVFPLVGVKLNFGRSK